MSSGDSSFELREGVDLTVRGVWLRVLIVAVTGVALVAVVVSHRSDPLLATLLSIVVLAYGALSIIDAAEQRLPNRITYPLALGTFSAVLIGGLARSDPLAGPGAILVGLAMAAVMFILRFGMGDVKLALTVGTIAAWLGIDAVKATVWGMAIPAAVVALGVIVIHRRRGMTFSYGPFLAIGSVVGMISAGSGL
jgi:leader peptidase (prepilin peptidase)/N-methyltransferase